MPWSSRPYGRQQSSADSTLTADLAAVEHRLDAVDAHRRADEVDPGRVRLRHPPGLPPGRPANSRREAALGLRRVSSLRVQSSGEHGDVPIVLDLGVLLEARDPLEELLVAAVVVQVRSDRLDELGHVSGVCPRAGVAKSPLGLAVRLEPGSRQPFEVTRERRLLLLELVPQLLANRVVVAEPLPVTVERDQDHLRALEAREHADGIGALEDGVAERRREAGEDRRPARERALLGREGREALVLQVAAQVGVAAPRAQRKPGQPDALGPAFGAFDHIIELRIRDGDAHRSKQRPRLASREGEVVQGQLEQLASRANSRQGGKRLRAPCQHYHRALGNALEERGDDVGGVGVERVGVVENEHERRLGRREGRRERGNRCSIRIEIRPTEAAESVGNGADEGGRIRPAPIERRERKGTVVPPRPLREQRGLPVSGRRDEHEHRLRACSPQPVYERGTGNLAGRRQAGVGRLQSPAPARCATDAPFHRLRPHSRALPFRRGLLPGQLQMAADLASVPHPIWASGWHHSRQPGPPRRLSSSRDDAQGPSRDHRSRHNHRIGGLSMPLADYPLLEVVWSMFIFFAFVIWVYLLILVLADNFRRHDHSGLAKAGWTLFVIFTPLIGVLVYMIARPHTDQEMVV